MSLLLGHRGLSSKHLENSLEAFCAALAAGMDGFELDVQPSRDGVCMVLHDETLDWHEYQANPELREVIDLLASGHFSNGDRGLFRPLVDSLLGRDEYLVLADFAAYVACQEQVAQAWQDPDLWTRMSILNVARSGKFSSDRSIREYCHDIWNVQPMPIEDDDIEMTA